MTKSLDQRIKDLDLEKILEEERKFEVRQICQKCNIPLAQYRTTNWNDLSQTSRLTCPECGYSKNTTSKKLS